MACVFTVRSADSLAESAGLVGGVRDDVAEKGVPGGETAESLNSTCLFVDLAENILPPEGAPEEDKKDRIE